MTKPIQKILFGSPGTGKSHRIDKEIIPNDLNINNESNIIKTVFHPEYTYGDFMGKLMPISRKKKTERKVEYNYYSGHFMKALAKAYKTIIDTYIDGQSVISESPNKTPDNVVLVIDELNRGNSAAIFGTVFQLLDRDISGWSSYGVSISDLEFDRFMSEIGFENKSSYNDYDEQLDNNWRYNEHTGLTQTKKNNLLSFLYKGLNDYRKSINPNALDVSFEKDRKIYLPPNFSILATINTSDNSIYFMDSAFKRRWDWEFIEIEDGKQKTALANRKISLYGQDKGEWCHFVDKLNSFIRGKYKVIRKIEDKQVGYRFINEPTITEVEIKNKLMFFIWDSVFNNNKKPLVDLLGVPESELVTFGQFTKEAQVKNFVTKILSL
jgi:5-methylcytosine-specific restriction endonuclease McrBC GTP-binding regulatory subunit McrB